MTKANNSKSTNFDLRISYTPLENLDQSYSASVNCFSSQYFLRVLPTTKLYTHLILKPMTSMFPNFGKFGKPLFQLCRQKMILVPLGFQGFLILSTTHFINTVFPCQLIKETTKSSHLWQQERLPKADLGLLQHPRWSNL